MEYLGQPPCSARTILGSLGLPKETELSAKLRVASLVLSFIYYFLLLLTLKAVKAVVVFINFLVTAVSM